MQRITKSAIISAAVTAWWTLGSRFALAESGCTLNGQEVPCGDVTGYLGAGLGIAAVFGLIGLASFVFWIMMVIHAASHEIENKAMWIVIMIFTGILGALIYYFVVKRNFAEKPAQSGTMPPATPAAPTPPTPPTSA